MCILDNNFKKTDVLNSFIYDDEPFTSCGGDTSLEELLEILVNTPLDEYLSIVDGGNYENCFPRHIPQYSNIESALISEVDLLQIYGHMPIEEVGSLLPGQTSINTGARVKYGENHSKLLEVLGLARVDGNAVIITNIGRIIAKWDDESRCAYVDCAIFRIPIIRNLLLKAKYSPVSILNELLIFLSDSTAKRRLPNVFRLIM